jgi:beta-N-acetylhexosaminidase
VEDWPPEGEDPFDFDTGERPALEPRELPERGRFNRWRRKLYGDEGEEGSLGPDEDPSDTREARRRAAERGAAFETGEYRRIRAQRARRRTDLPANVRRRRLIALLLLMLLVAAAIYLLFLRGDDGDEAEQAEIPPKRLAGQTLISPLPAAGADNALLQRVERGQVGGVIVGTDDEAAVQRETGELQAAAQRGGNPPLLVMVDQESASVKQLPGPPDLSPDELAAEGPDTAESEGTDTGEYLRGLGVNVNLAPVVDVAYPQTEETILSRTYSDDPTEVGELGAAFVRGVQSQGVAATAKHFPGLGLATQNTDFAPVEVTGTEEDLAADLEPFTATTEAGVDLIMVSTASSQSSAEQPAAFSADVIQKQLRSRMGFGGLVITDDLETPAVTVGPGSAALQALRAGADLSLFAQTEGAPDKALRSIVDALREGRLDQETVQAAYDRIVGLKQRLTAGGTVSTPPAPGDEDEQQQIEDSSQQEPAVGLSTAG